MNDAADRTMREARPAPSPALRAANERLLALRAQLERQSDPPVPPTETAVANPSGPQDPITHLCTPRYLRQLLAEGNGRFGVCEGSDKV